MAKHLFGKGNTYSKGIGRPKGTSYVALCQTWSEEKGGGWDILFAWARGKEGKKRVPVVLRKFAIERILSYGYGKPRESIAITNPDNSIAAALRSFISGGERGLPTGGLREPGKVLYRSAGDKSVGETA